MRDRGAVLDPGHFEAFGLQATDRGFAAGTRSLHPHLDLAHALADDLLGAEARGQLGGAAGAEVEGCAGAVRKDSQLAGQLGAAGVAELVSPVV